MHHATKLTRPRNGAVHREATCGTAPRQTVQPPETREGDAGRNASGEEGNVAVHSVRLPGFVADRR